MNDLNWFEAVYQKQVQQYRNWLIIMEDYWGGGCSRPDYILADLYIFSSRDQSETCIIIVYQKT